MAAYVHIRAVVPFTGPGAGWGNREFTSFSCLTLALGPKKLLRNWYRAQSFERGVLQNFHAAIPAIHDGCMPHLHLSHYGWNFLWKAFLGENVSLKSESKLTQPLMILISWVGKATGGTSRPLYSLALVTAGKQQVTSRQARMSPRAKVKLVEAKSKSFPGLGWKSKSVTFVVVT